MAKGQHSEKTNSEYQSSTSTEVCLNTADTYAQKGEEECKEVENEDEESEEGAKEEGQEGRI